MSIVTINLSFGYDPTQPIFSNINISFSEGDKIAIIGANGSGKSTLLKLIAGELRPLAGNISCSERPYYIPQQAGHEHISVAHALKVDTKLAALQAITEGSVLQSDYDTLGDDWQIEARCSAALSQWSLPEEILSRPMDELSGGERTRVALAGISIHDPQIVLLDEPTNHLDRDARRMLYDYISRTKATVIVVSHDTTLLNRIDITCEITSSGIRTYGGNYTFYREQKQFETTALQNDIADNEKEIRLARLKAQQVKERQQRRENFGEKHKDQLPRIMRKGAMNRGQNTASRLKGDHDSNISELSDRLTDLRSRREATAALKIDFDDAQMHSGKLLVSLTNVNYSYLPDHPLWSEPQNVQIYSGERIRISGGNGSGKTTLLKIITGEITPTKGKIERTPFCHIYMDQEYSMAETDISVLQLAQQYNLENLAEHEVKTRLHRALFPQQSWDKPCRTLSGGERMRLTLCCLMLSNHVPDMMILDEPTNNLDVGSLEILREVVADYRGTVVLICHDDDFAAEIGITREIFL